MAGNRTGVYIAFDGLGETNPTKSDFKYYSTIQAWNSHKNIDFKFVDSHDKTAAVSDRSKRVTLEARIRERLSMSKNIVVILSSKTRKKGSMLSYEIEQAVDKYKLPLIIVYVDYNVVASPSILHRYWPESLKERIDNKTSKAIHIPFSKNTLFDAIGQFNVNNLPSTSQNYYTKEAHQEFGQLSAFASFINTLKS
jgi:hypothetical protein